MQIRLVKNGDELVEWMVVELQGRIELGPGGQTLAGQHFGNLEWKGEGEGDKDQGGAKLIIGHQMLEGKLSELDKPLLVMDRASSLDSVGAEGAMTSNEATKSCKVLGIVRKKLVFSERPKPIITPMTN